jgi:hypothetical protein
MVVSIENQMTCRHLGKEVLVVPLGFESPLVDISILVISLEAQKHPIQHVDHDAAIFVLSASLADR